ncbi:E3 ubiquitin-protein ligase MIB1-like isoform X2 [Octopus sinensis]|uniref:E3 ubiquitin-protein ligase MIB1-like isoform X2 n=1 Tax=Octopus sinensis TaxID=2607531 RepID=A0A7E6FQ31_9MOLL|nr:E3 ubiquitin-protein ligase MIB1-like isoform X2 [Octopus sinensis]
MTPLLEAVSRGHLGMTHKLIALGASINAVDGEGNSCLHLAMETEVFNSEGAPMDLLNECCTATNLKKKRSLSGIVVARYLASQGADFHHKNNKNNRPLDLIKDPNLRKNLETFLQPQCLLCRNKAATTKVHPCEHLLTCEECSNIPLQQCLKCLKPVITGRGRVGAPEFEDRCVQTEATCQELGAASQAIGAPEFEDRCVQTEATCQELGAASQAIGAPEFEDRCVQTEATCQELGAASQAIEAPKFEDRRVKTEATCQELGAASQVIESPVLKERNLMRVAKRLGSDWWQVAIFLGVDTTELKIDDESIDTVKQGYLMLREWFKNCDPETRTHATLSAALEEAECFTAMECLSLDAK